MQQTLPRHRLFLKQCLREKFAGVNQLAAVAKEKLRSSEQETMRLHIDHQRRA